MFAGWYELIHCRFVLRADSAVQAAEIVFELLYAFRTDDYGGDGRIGERPSKSELCQRFPVRLSQRLKLLCDFVAFFA